MEEYAVFEPNLQHALIELAVDFAHQTMNRTLDCRRRRKQPLTKALAGATVDENAIMTGNSDLEDALIVEQLVERPSSNKLRNRLFGQPV